MFTRHRHDSPDKLNYPHAMGTDTFSPQWPRSFRHILLLPSPHSTPSLRSVAQGRLRLLPRTQADESSNQGGTSHPKIAKSAILGCGTQRSFKLQVYEYVVLPEHVRLLLSELQQDTSSGSTAPRKPKDGLNGRPVEQTQDAAH